MANPYEQEIFDHFLKATQQQLPNINLIDHCRTIEKELSQVDAAVRKFIDTLLKEPFIAIFGVWIKKCGYLYPGMLDAAKTLLEHNLIMIYDNNGAIWTVEKANAFDHHKTLNAIRCKSSWSIKRREELVRVYVAFMYWLHIETRGHIHRCEDPDWARSLKRNLAFPRFIDFLDALSNTKSQLVAKLLYFGGNRTLEQVLKLDISNIDFDAHTILWEPLTANSELTSYPEHVFHDIKALTDIHKKGLVFLGRQDGPLSDATIFRHFNEAAQKVGLGDSFGPKKLVTDM